MYNFILRYSKYLHNLKYRLKTIYYTFPSQVYIENTNYCNANCIMCPRDKLTRQQGIMEFSLYKKIINEISKFRYKISRIHLHNYGEPLLDKLLPQRIKLAKDYGIKHTYFVTNASLFTPELSEAIIESGLDEIKFSFCGSDKKTYESTMKGLDFNKTIQGIDIFLKKRKDMGKSKPRIIIQYIPQKTDTTEIDDFKNLFKNRINSETCDTLTLFRFHNYGGGRSYNLLSKKFSVTCDFPWATLVILFDGSVSLCCMDYNGLQIVGNLKENTIQEIWNGEVMNKIRSDFTNLDYKNYPVCMKCDWIR